MTGRSRLPLTERLRPHRLDDLVGNPRARYELKNWALEWETGGSPSRRAVVLSGPPGVGKTTAALALAEELGWNLVEMNASDARNESAVEQVAGRASVSHTLSADFARGHPHRALILLDEADCLTGRITDTTRAKPTPPALSEFLRARYGTIAALNAAWGLPPKGKPRAFEDWSSVPRSPGNAGWARLAAARKDLDEWRSSGKSRDLSDRGGLGAIARLVQTTHQPIVLTVNDERTLTRYSAVFRTQVRRITFYPVRDSEVGTLVERVARTEKIALYPGALESIVKRAHGDVRAALNDLEAVAPLPAGPSQLSVLGFRDQTSDIIRLTEEALTSTRYYRNVEIQDRLDAPPDDLLPWIEENAPAFAPDAAHRAEALRTVASAEMMLARARRFRVYGLWSYASEVMTGGVSFALRDSGSGPSTGAAVSFPRFLGEMGQSRAFRALRDAIAGKTGARFHLSRGKVRESFLPMLEALVAAGVQKNAAVETRRLAVRVCRELELSPDEIAFLVGEPTGSKSVSGLVASVNEPEVASEPEPLPGTPETAGEPAASARRPVQRQLSEFPE